MQPTAATGANGQTSGTIASTVAEAKTVSVQTINGVTVTQTKVVTFTAGTVDGDQSTVSVSPASVQADGSATSTITVTAKDAGGNPIGGIPGASVVTRDPDWEHGSATDGGDGGQWADERDDRLDGSGSQDGVGNDQWSGGDADEGGDVHGRDGGWGSSTVSVSPASVQADGTDVDDHSNSQRRGRKPDCRDPWCERGDQRDRDWNTVVQPTAATGANGQTSGTIASTVAEAKTVSVTINGVAVTQTKVVTFTAGTVDGDHPQ